jgi:hypothetical protein
MKIEITRVKSARICLFHFDDILAKDVFRAYIAYAECNNREIPPNWVLSNPLTIFLIAFFPTLASSCPAHPAALVEALLYSRNVDQSVEGLT